MESINAGQLRRNPNRQFHGIALRPAGREQAEAAMRTAEKITAAILALSYGVRRVCEAVIATPARLIAEASMGAAENVARVIIKTVDVAQHRRNVHS